jgi:hypothetical protein
MPKFRVALHTAEAVGHYLFAMSGRDAVKEQSSGGNKTIGHRGPSAPVPNSLLCAFVPSRGRGFAALSSFTRGAIFSVGDWSDPMDNKKRKPQRRRQRVGQTDK